MKVLGVTGGVGMGKSTCSDLLRQRGVAVIDTDQLARQIVEPGQPALAEVRDVFGAELLDDAGRLRRDLMAQRVFSDPVARQKLEAILHPRIRKLWQAQVKEWRMWQLPLGVVIIPLLFETHAQTEFDAVICVACSAETQLARLRARGWPDQQIQQRIAAQWPVDQKIAKANYVIWTEGSLAVHAAQLDQICR
jgi:dephospho-CoA kinase